MASRDKMILSSSVRLPIKIGPLEAAHEAFVCKSLVAPVGYRLHVPLWH